MLLYNDLNFNALKYIDSKIVNKAGIPTRNARQFTPSQQRNAAQTIPKALIFFEMKKILLSQAILLLAFIVAGIAQANAQCVGPLSVQVLGSGSGISLSASESHVNAQCPYNNGSATISASGGTAPYTGIGNFSQPVGTQAYTVMDMMGCMASVSVTITSNPRPTGVISGSTVICSGQAATLSINVTGTGPFNGTLSTGQTFSGAGPTITVLVSPTMSTTYTISTLIDTYCISDPGDLTGSATVGVQNCVNISGRVIWEGKRLTTMTGVNLTTVKLTGDATDIFLTAPDGNYSFSTTSGNNFMVTPTKNRPMPHAINGVSAADASRIQQHIIGAFLINDVYKLIAADVNKDNSISAADATLIQQALLGNLSAQNWFANNTWRFVPKAYVFPNEAIPWGFPEKITITMPGNYINQHFIGMKLGDVNSTANPVNAPGAAPNLVWKAKDQLLAAGAITSLEFRAENYQDLLALQFGMRFDPKKLELLEIEPIAGSPLQTGNFGLYNVAAGEIRTFLFGIQGASLPNGTSGFRIRFKALQNGVKLSEVLELDDSVLLGEAYNSNYTSGPVSLVYEGVVTGTNEPVAVPMQLYQNRPNPFASETTVGFVLPKSAKAELRITDAGGRVVYSKIADYPAGYHELQFKPAELAPGLLSYELITKEGRLSHKMMLMAKE